MQSKPRAVVDRGRSSREASRSGGRQRRKEGDCSKAEDCGKESLNNDQPRSSHRKTGDRRYFKKNEDEDGDNDDSQLDIGEQSPVTPKFLQSSPAP